MDDPADGLLRAWFPRLSLQLAGSNQAEHGNDGTAEHKGSKLGPGSARQHVHPVSHDVKLGVLS